MIYNIFPLMGIGRQSLAALVLRWRLAESEVTVTCH